MRKYVILFFLIYFLHHVQGISQKKQLQLSLNEVIEIAQSQSLQVIIASHRFQQGYWEYRTHVAKFLPGLNMEMQFPWFNRSIETIRNPDGTNTYAYVSENRTYANLNLNQNIGLTGGSIFVRSDLSRTDEFENDNSITYVSTPVRIGYRQPLNGYNELRWEKKIEPVKYEEAKKNYIESMEEITVRVVNYFFNLALAQLNIDISALNFQNADTLYKIATGRYNLGTIAEDELYQMELSYLNADAESKQARIDLEVNKFQLRSFLGYNENVNIELIIPNKIPNLEIGVDSALYYAKVNNPNLLSLQRQLLEASMEVAQTKAEKGFNADLYASFGLTQSSANIPDVYKNPEDQQIVQIGASFPILDWGLGRGRYKMARSNEELVRTQVQQEEIDFEQEILLSVMQFNLQDDLLRIAAKSDTVAQIRYEVAKQRFLIGKIDVLDLNVALQEKDVARRGYIASLRNYWRFFYDVRRLTLYDFIDKKSLEANFDELIK
ncbi:MAG: TolC family protein [Bacteroidales bacterium]|nr:TolC family protein [Bacteroidales bacterium]